VVPNSALITPPRRPILVPYWALFTSGPLFDAYSTSKASSPGPLFGVFHQSAAKRIRIYSEVECERILKAASQVQNDSILAWDITITLALTTAMRKSELLNLARADIDFESQVVEVSPKEDTPEILEWRIKDTDRRTLPLKEDVIRLLVNLQDQRPAGYPHVLVPPRRYDLIQRQLRTTGKWTLSHARTAVVNNFKTMFDTILAAAHIKGGTFHDLRKTAITEWFYQG